MTDLDADAIRQIVRQVIAEEREVQAEQMDTIVLKTISTILTGFGINDDDRKEIREDFVHLRKWRKSTEQVQRVSWTVVVTTLAGGILGALWLGFQTMFGKH